MRCVVWQKLGIGSLSDVKSRQFRNVCKQTRKLYFKNKLIFSVMVNIFKICVDVKCHANYNEKWAINGPKRRQLSSRAWKIGKRWITGKKPVIS